MFFSCIIPAYNEWPRIAAVIQAVLDCTEIDEVIVIDDGSTDNTWNVIDTFESPKLQKIKLEKNQGKTRAVFHWINHSSWDYIVLIDSDLLNLYPRHIQKLIKPIIENKANATFSMRENSFWIYRILGYDFITGERVIHKSIFSDLQYFLNGPSYGLEVKINNKLMETNSRIMSVKLDGVITPWKTMKVGKWQWFLESIDMGYQVLRSLPLWKTWKQCQYFYKQKGNAYKNHRNSAK